MSELQITPFVVEGQLAISSLDIAETTGKRHDHVMRDIRSMLTELHGESDVPRFGGVYPGANGEDRPCFNLPEREFMILVTGYSVTRRAKVIDRWRQLEAQAQGEIVSALPKDFPSALRALADSVDRAAQLEQRVVETEAAKAELEHQVEQLEPMAEAWHRFANADGLFGIQQAGRALGLGPNKFAERLRPRYLFYQDGVLTPRAEFVTRGIFQVKSQLVGETVRARTWITPKGIAYFGKKLGAQPSGTAH